MPTLLELFSVLDDIDFNNSEVEIALEPDPALHAAHEAIRTGGGLGDALQMVEAQIACARPVLRGVIHNVIDIKNSKKEVNPDRLRRMLCDLHLAAFKIHTLKRNWSEARDHLVRAKACGSNNPYPDHHFIELYVEMGEYSAALSTLKKVAGDEEDAPFFHFQLATDLDALGAKDKAREAYMWALANDAVGLVRELCRIRLDAIGAGEMPPSPEELQGHFERGREAMMAGEAADALHHLLNIVAVDRASAEAWFIIGYIYRIGVVDSDVFRKRMESSLETIEEVFADADRYAELQRAVQAFRYAIDAQPDLAAAHNELAQCYLWLERPEHALMPARSYAKLLAGEVEPHVNLAIILLSCGEVDSAIEELRIALELDPDDPIAISTWQALATLTSEEEIDVL